MRAGVVSMIIVGGLVPPLVGCSADPKCAGIASVDQGVAAGQPSARAALDSLLASHPKWLDLTGWTESYRASTPNRTVTFTAGPGDKVEVYQSSKNGRWYLDGYRGCR